MWNNWIKKIVRPISALLVIDVQNDFISGSLAITNCPAGQDGEEVRLVKILKGTKFLTLARSFVEVVGNLLTLDTF